MSVKRQVHAERSAARPPLASGGSATDARAAGSARSEGLLPDLQEERGGEADAVAEEISLDQQSGAARQIGQMPPLPGEDTDLLPAGTPGQRTEAEAKSVDGRAGNGNRQSHDAGSHIKAGTGRGAGGGKKQERHH